MGKEEFLKLLVESIRRTETSYYKRSDDSLLERPFCYEFYHQFRLLQGDDCSLMLSGEPSKTLSYHINGNKYPDKEDKNRIYPDFILHKGLNDNDSKNQIAAIEVKQKGNIEKDKLEGDIKKIQKMMENLSFDFGVFIAIGMKNEELAVELRKTDKGVCKYPDKVYFIATMSVDDEKKYISYSDILEK